MSLLPKIIPLGSTIVDIYVHPVIKTRGYFDGKAVMRIDVVRKHKWLGTGGVVEENRSYVYTKCDWEPLWRKGHLEGARPSRRLQSILDAAWFKYEFEEAKTDIAVGVLSGRKISPYI